MKCDCDSQDKIVGNKEVKNKEEHLEEIGKRGMGWVYLFRCKMCDTLWELTYPNGGYHGGGEPLLSKVDKTYVTQNYPEKNLSSK